MIKVCSHYPNWPADCSFSLMTWLPGFPSELTTPSSMSFRIRFPVSNPSVIVFRMTPTGPVLTHPLQYRPITQYKADKLKIDCSTKDN